MDWTFSDGMHPGNETVIITQILATLERHRLRILHLFGNSLLRNGSNLGNLRRYLFTPSHEPEIAHLHIPLSAELHEGFVFPFAPAWIIEEFVERNHGAGDYRVGELGGFLRCPELARKFDVLRRFRELPVQVIPDAMLHLLFERPKQIGRASCRER